MTLEEYDAWTTAHLPEKIPDPAEADARRRVGDSIYEWTGANPRQRTGVHLEGNIKTDLGGRNALLSMNFYYFGTAAIPLPHDLRPIVQQT